MTDPTGDPHAEFQIRPVYESEMENEKKIVQEGKLSEIYNLPFPRGLLYYPLSAQEAEARGCKNRVAVDASKGRCVY
jgi:hypothetical protein